MNRPPLLLAFAALLVSLPVAHAGASLLLQDGRVLDGVGVQRAPGLYLLEQADGEVVPVPEELVRELRLTGTDDPAPTGLRQAEPENVAGYARLSLPVRSEQLAAFGGRRATFAPGPIDPTWRPTSDWSSDPAQNEFNPARWAHSPIDPTWTPVSAFHRSQDVTSFNPARWYRSPFGSAWQPRDGFGPTAWFPKVLEGKPE